MASSLTLQQASSFIEKMGELYDVRQFTEVEAKRVLDLAKASLEWEAAIKKELSKAGLPPSSDQIPLLRCCLESLAPLFSLYSLEADKDNVSALLHNVSASKALDAAVTEKLMALGLPVSPENVKKLGNNEECLNYTAPFPRDFFILDEVKTLRPEYLVGTWFNRLNRPFKLNMELDWVNRLVKGNCALPTQMLAYFYASTGDHIWDLISEVHVHRSSMKEFSRPRDGWIEVPGDYWKYEALDSPLNFIERMMNVSGGRTVVCLSGGTGGWATFEQVRNSEVTAAAARLLFKFSDPLYCARSDGKVVIKLKDVASRATLIDMTKFPSRRTLVTDRNKFPSCIP